MLIQLLERIPIPRDHLDSRSRYRYQRKQHRPGGYLIIFDLTILQDVEEPTLSNGQLPRPIGQSSTKHSPSDEAKDLQGLRTVGIILITLRIQIFADAIARVRACVRRPSQLNVTVIILQIIFKVTMVEID